MLKIEFGLDFCTQDITHIRQNVELGPSIFQVFNYFVCYIALCPTATSNAFHI